MDSRSSGPFAVRPIGWATVLATLVAILLIVVWFDRTRARRPPTDPGALIGATIAGMPEPVITSLADNSIADTAGLRVGDRIEAVNGRSAHSMKELSADLRLAEPGPLYIEVKRGKKILVVQVPSASGGEVGQQDSGR